jgi:hypothetical protein
MGKAGSGCQQKASPFGGKGCFEQVCALFTFHLRALSICLAQRVKFKPKIGKFHARFWSVGSMWRSGQVFDENSAASSSQEAVFTFETAVARDSEEVRRVSSAIFPAPPLTPM